MENTPQNPANIQKQNNRRQQKPRAITAAAQTASTPEGKPFAKKKNFFKRRPQSTQQRHNGGKYVPNRNPLAHKLVSNVSGLVGKSLKVIIPWVLLSTLVFSTGAYFVFNSAVEGQNFPLWYTVLLSLFIFGVYGLFGLLYGIAMALLYSVKIFSESFAAIIKDTVHRVKNSIESRIDNISESLSQSDISRVVKQTFGELSSNIRTYAAQGAAGIFTVAALITVLFLARKAFLKSISKIKNKAEFFALFSARVTLVLAVILNLTFFTRLAVAAGYLIGLIVILSQVIAVALIR